MPSPTERVANWRRPSRRPTLAGGGEADASAGPRRRCRRRRRSKSGSRSMTRGKQGRALAGSSSSNCWHRSGARWRCCRRPTRRSETGNAGRSVAQEERRKPTAAPAGIEIEKRVNEENARPKKRYISPATREAEYAIYYDSLRRKHRGARHARLPGAEREEAVRRADDEHHRSMPTGRVIEADIVRAVDLAHPRPARHRHRARGLDPSAASRPTCASRPTRSSSPRAFVSRATTGSKRR